MYVNGIIKAYVGSFVVWTEFQQNSWTAFHLSHLGISTSSESLPLSCIAYVADADAKTEEELMRKNVT